MAPLINQRRDRAVGPTGLRDVTGVPVAGLIHSCFTKVGALGDGAEAVPSKKYVAVVFGQLDLLMSKANPRNDKIIKDFSNVI